MINKPYQSPQSLTLRFMRENRKYTLLFVGAQLKIKPKTLDHMEHGRKVISEEQLQILLRFYDYSVQTFEEMCLIKPLNKQSANHYFLTKKKSP